MTATFDYRYVTEENHPPTGVGCRVISRRNYHEKHSRWQVPGFIAGSDPAWARDLLRCARAVFLADKLSRRGATDDEWTRTIRLSVPVAEPARWRDAARSYLHALLRGVTGDIWEVEFRQSNEAVQGSLDLTHYRADEVALFSGGLDSLSWAARRVGDSTRGPLHLVMFRDVRLRELQDDIYRRVTDKKRTRRVVHQSVLPQEVRSKEGVSGGLEPSSRSRGLLYTAAGVLVAAANEVPSVQVPENGQVAFNPPLSPARSGACSTRSVHPWTIHLLNRLIKAVGGTVRVENPLWWETKGQVCDTARTSGLEADDLAKSVSCGRSPWLYGRNRIAAHCGCCFPCLIRRSGLLHAYGDDPTRYVNAPWELPMPRSPKKSDPTEDWRALAYWLHSPLTLRNVVADHPLPPGWHPGRLYDVIAAGRDELTALVRAAQGTDPRG